jgi:hypothetical protein
MSGTVEIRRLRMDGDFHARAVANVAKEAHEQGHVEKAMALYRSILKHHHVSLEAMTALNYLMVGHHLPADRANSGTHLRN